MTFFLYIWLFGRLHSTLILQCPVDQANSAVNNKLLPFHSTFCCPENISRYSFQEHIQRQYNCKVTCSLEDIRVIPCSWWRWVQAPRLSRRWQIPVCSRIWNLSGSSRRSFMRKSSIKTQNQFSLNAIRIQVRCLTHWPC